MKKLVIYVDSLAPSGGRERVVSNLLGYWNEKYEIVLLTKDTGNCFYELPQNLKKISLNCPLHLDMSSRVNRIKSIILNFCKSVYSLKKYLKQIEFDYIYTATPLNSFEVYLTGIEIGKKLVISEHASINAFNRVYMWMKKVVYPKAYCISVPNSMDTKSYLEWGCSAVFIPHTVTFPATSRNKLNQKVVLNVGRLTADKQQAKLISIWSQIKDKNGWKLMIVGDGEEKERLHQLIQQKGVSDTVYLCGARKDIDQVYRNASIFAFTSRCEGFGMVLLEAMSFGIPCISFDCPSGPRDIVINGENGFLIDNNCEDEFCNKLQEMLLYDEGDLLKLGERAFKTVQDWDNEEILSRWDMIFK